MSVRHDLDLVREINSRTTLRCDACGATYQPKAHWFGPTAAIRSIAATREGWLTSRDDAPESVDYCPACIAPAAPESEPDEEEVGHA